MFVKIVYVIVSRCAELVDRVALPIVLYCSMKLACSIFKEFTPLYKFAAFCNVKGQTTKNEHSSTHIGSSVRIGFV